MKQALCQAFPGVTYWDTGYQGDLWTLSGCYGAYVIPWLLGCTLRYAPDRWPTIVPGSAPSPSALQALTVEAVLSSPRAEALFGQMDVIAAEGGQIHGYLNWQGVLNNAFHLRGQQVFLDMLDDAPDAHRLFSLLCQVMIAVARRVQERQRGSGFYVDHLCVSNCTLNMISPQAYDAFLLPHDRQIAESFERFGVHTCNWDVTPYLSSLRKLPKVGYLDMGMCSDMRRVRELFPQARRAVLYSPVKLQEAPLGEIEADMARIWRELAPCDVVMADIQATTPDARVKALLRICQDLEAEVSR
jgi:hypothetical protein